MSEPLGAGGGWLGGLVAHISYGRRMRDSPHHNNDVKTDFQSEECRKELNFSNFSVYSVSCDFVYIWRDKSFWQNLIVFSGCWTMKIAD